MFGERLKKLRLDKGMTQAELAKRINVTDSMITQIERGTKQASAALIADLIKVLDCTADFLITGKTTR